MNKQELLIKKLKEPLPDKMISELLTFAEFLEMKYLKTEMFISSVSESFLNTLASEKVLAKEWNTPEEDEAWAHL